MARLTYPLHVPFDAQKQIEQIVTAASARLDPDNAVDVLHDAAIEIWETLFPCARQESRPWSVATFERTVDELVTQLVDDGYACLADPILVVVSLWGTSSPVPSSQRTTDDDSHRKPVFARRVYAALDTDTTWRQRYTHMLEVLAELEQRTDSADAPPSLQPSVSVVDTRRPFKVKEAAHQLRKSPSTIRRWIKTRKIKPNALGLVPRAEVERLLATPNFQFPDRDE